jgi:hypothetical protein
MDSADELEDDVIDEESTENVNTNIKRYSQINIVHGNNVKTEYPNMFTEVSNS